MSWRATLGAKHSLSSLLILTVAIATASVAAAQQGGWVKHEANPLMQDIFVGSVTFDGATYSMWTDTPEGIKLFTSTDGIEWAEHAANPVLGLLLWKEPPAAQPNNLHDLDFAPPARLDLAHLRLHDIQDGPEGGLGSSRKPLTGSAEAMAHRQKGAPVDPDVYIT